MNIYDLTDRQVDKWTALAQDWTLSDQLNDSYTFWEASYDSLDIAVNDYSPTQDGNQALALTMLSGFSQLAKPSQPDMSGAAYVAKFNHGMMIRANNPHRAICLAVIARKFGMEVDEK